MFLRYLGVLSLTVLAVSANAQVFADDAHKIVIPPSSQHKEGIYHTEYFVNIAPDPLQHGPTEQGIHPMVSAPGYYPADIRAAYKMPSAGGSGAIAIVDAYHNPAALTDFNHFAATFGLPQETSTNPTLSTNKVFQVVYQGGTAPASNRGWAGEIALDIEWAHAVAPKAKIYLVEAKSAYNSDLWAAIKIAKALPGVHEVSMSFGGSEYAGQTTLDAAFSQPGVTFFASSGDTGGVAEYPSESPNVVAVGGTNLAINTSGVVTSETAWGVVDSTHTKGGAGGGISTVEPRPSYQDVIASLVGAKRGAPDISAVADPNTGVAVYSTYAFVPNASWQQIGGTSLACPVTAAIANVRGNYAASTAAENSRNYFFLRSNRFRDITVGHAGTYAAAVGWDKITGCGSPVGMWPTAKSYAPTAISTLFGTHNSGALAQILTQDATYYTVTTKPSATATYGESAQVGVYVPFSAAASTYAKVQLYFNITTTQTVPVDVYLYNFTTKAYVYGGYFTSGSTVSNIYWTPATTASANALQDATHRFYVVLEPHRPASNSVAFKLNVDRVYGVGYN